MSPNSNSTGATSERLTPDDRLFADAELVFHFAGIGDIVPSIERPAEYMSVNVQGTVRVLECARAAKARKFVYAASSSCYGLADVPTREDHPIRPEHPYALSKYCGEQAALHWHQVYGMPVNAIRIFNAYGPRVRTTGAYGAVFGVFFKQKLAGKPFTVVGDGTQKRDFLYVTDIADAFLRAAESDLFRRDLEPRRRRSAERQPAGGTDRRPGGAYPQAARRTGRHLGRYRQDQPAISAGVRACRSTKACGG